MTFLWLCLFLPRNFPANSCNKQRSYFSKNHTSSYSYNTPWAPAHTLCASSHQCKESPRRAYPRNTTWSPESRPCEPPRECCPGFPQASSTRDDIVPSHPDSSLRLSSNPHSTSTRIPIPKLIILSALVFLGIFRFYFFVSAWSKPDHSYVIESKSPPSNSRSKLQNSTYHPQWTQYTKVHCIHTSTA